MRACACVCVHCVCVYVCGYMCACIFKFTHQPLAGKSEKKNRIGAPRRRKLFTSDSDNRKRKRERISGSIFIFGCFGKLGRNKEIGVPHNSLLVLFFVVFIYIYIYMYMYTSL